MTKTFTLVALDRSRQTAEGNARSEEILYHRRGVSQVASASGKPKEDVVPFILSFPGFQQQSRFESDIPSRRSVYVVELPSRRLRCRRTSINAS